MRSLISKVAPRVRYYWNGLVLLGAVVFLTVWWNSLAATYNFYFNNTEQGDNSTATPNVNITGQTQANPGQNKGENNVAPESGELSKSGGDPAQQTPELPKETTEPAPETSTAQVTAAVLPEAPGELKRLRVGFYGNVAGLKGTTTYHSEYGSPWTNDDFFPSPGLGLELGYKFTRVFAMNAFGGANYIDHLNKGIPNIGLEAEFLPFRLGTGRYEGFLELGFLAGGSSLMHAADNVATLHAGVRANVNLTKNFGLSVSGRANLGYFALNAGLISHF